MHEIVMEREFVKKISQEQDEDFERLSWIYIRNNKVLFVRKKDTDVFFDPGCRRVPGQDDKATLAQKIKEDFSVDLEMPFELMTSFAAPAYGKPDDVMVEMRCYWVNPIGVLRPAPYLEQAWFTGSDAYDEQGQKQRTSDAGKHILQWLSQHGLIYM